MNWRDDLSAGNLFQPQTKGGDPALADISARYGEHGHTLIGDEAPLSMGLSGCGAVESTELVRLVSNMSSPATRLA